MSSNNKTTIHRLLNYSRNTSASEDHPSIGIPIEIVSFKWLSEYKYQEMTTPHIYHHYTILLVKKGAATQWIDLEKGELSENRVYCIYPGQVHQLASFNNLHGYVISVSPAYLSGSSKTNFLYAQGISGYPKMNPFKQVTAKATFEMVSIVDKIYREYTATKPFKSEMLIDLLSVLLIHIVRQLETKPAGSFPLKGYRVVKDFFSLLEKHYRDKKSIFQYASELSITPGYLNTIVKKVSGNTASYHIQQRVITEAKRIVAYSNLSMKEIAYHLGFADPCHFSKYFKQVHGKSFSEFRKGFIP